MGVDAWIMFLVGTVGLLGGLIFFLWHAYKEGKKDVQEG